jgi:hypothetical protein
LTCFMPVAPAKARKVKSPSPVAIPKSVSEAGLIPDWSGPKPENMVQ